MMLTDATTEELWDALRALDHEELDNHVTAVLLDEVKFRAGEPGMDPAELVKNELYTHHERYEFHGFLKFKKVSGLGYFVFERNGRDWVMDEDEVLDKVCPHERGQLIQRLDARERDIGS